MRQTFFGSPKSIAGAAMVGLGLLILVGNLDGAATEWSRLIGATRGETLGVLPSLVLAAARVMQAYAADQRRFLQGFLEHLLVLFWPLLLVIVGTALSQYAFTDKVEALPKPCKSFQKTNTGNVDFAALVRRVSRTEVSGDRSRRESQFRTRNYKETQRCDSW